jgi:hypothetical protein
MFLLAIVHQLGPLVYPDAAPWTGPAVVVALVIVYVLLDNAHGRISSKDLAKDSKKAGDAIASAVKKVGKEIKRAAKDD